VGATLILASSAAAQEPPSPQAEPVVSRPAEPDAAPSAEQPASSAENAIPAPEEPAIPPQRVIPLGLCEVVARALASNLDIAVERFVPDIRDSEVLIAKGEFDPIFRVDYSYSEAEVPQSSVEGLATSAGTTETHENELTGSLFGKLISGAEYNLVFDRQFSQFIRHDAFDPVLGPLGTIEDPWEYVLDTYVEVTQPLLRDFGLNANLAGIRIARAQRSISLYDFRQNVIDIIAEVQRAYWNLVLAIENLRVTENSLVLARDLLRENRIRLEVGTMSVLEVIEAEAGVAQREEGVIVSRSLVKDAEDNLKRLLNLSRDSDEWNVIIVPTDKPVILEEEFSLSDQIEIALENRPDYKSSLTQVESDRINVQFARNQTLPVVDMLGRYEFQAVDNDLNNALDDIGTGESPSWQAGLTLEYPIGNRAAKGNYEAARLTEQQSMLVSENLRLLIIVDVRQAIRSIETSLKSIQASRKTTEFSQRSLEAEQKKLEVGISTSHDVLEFLDALIDAQRREAIARVNYRLALVNLAAATGTILERSNIVINEEF